MTDAEEVKFHSRLKHEFIKIYLDFYRLNVVKNSTTKKTHPPYLQIYDLYAAKGLCHCDEMEIADPKHSTWPGSALIAAQCIGEYPRSTRLFLNSYHPDIETCKDQRAALEKNLNEYFAVYPTLKSKTEIISKCVEEAIVDASRGLVPNYPNVWILDPYDPISWDVISSIANFKGAYASKGKMIERRPELIINLMSSILQRFSETNPEVTSSTLGLPEDEWKPIFEQYKKESGNAREAILRLYFDRLKELYGKDPVFVLVRDVTSRAVVYAMLFCSTSESGYFVMLKHGLPKFHQFEIEFWQESAKKIMTKRKTPGQQFLDVGYQ
jgi:three-Cys-motif partner protein